MVSFFPAFAFDMHQDPIEVGAGRRLVEGTGMKEGRFNEKLGRIRLWMLILDQIFLFKSLLFHNLIGHNDINRTAGKGYLVGFHHYAQRDLEPHPENCVGRC